MQCRLFGLALLVIQRTCKSQCPNSCNRKGACDIFGSCSCFSGWTGSDCSLRSCPWSYAWTDYASSDDTAHAKAECSNRGLCDRITGSCECMEGFTGRACEHMACDFNCHYHGECLSMRRLALTQYSDESERFAYESPWDADKIYGCVCDSPYTATFNCGMRVCPSGDDPLTSNQVNEVQILTCMATSGKFVLLLHGKPTGDIRKGMHIDQFIAALQESEAIDAVSVTFSVDNGTACQEDSINAISIEFTQNFGSLPPLIAVTDDLEGTVTISGDGVTILRDTANFEYLSVKGTKEDEQCSNRGLCDPFSATCTCMNTNSDTYSSSDGYGNEGDRGDCGHAVTIINECPGDVACSDHGVCDATSYRCACEDGWFGADCSLRSCPLGLAWFSYPSESNMAHDEWVECSGGGICDYTLGLCTCGAQFSGAACEYLACPGGSATACTGHGRCASMAELALAATDNGDASPRIYGADPNSGLTWDANRVFGCDCDSGWAGYDCSLRTCSFGDDPNTYGQTNEVQLFECEGTGGTFRLIFRQKATLEIPFNATRDDLETLIEALNTITDVDVVFSNGNSTCTDSSLGYNVVGVTFNTEHGDIPSMTADTSLLYDTNYGTQIGGGTVTFFTDGAAATSNDLVVSVVGTTEEIECSGRGLCDRLSGTCSCFDGYSSSDGMGGSGSQGDCGHRSLCNAAWCAQ
mmetsp:Transcript_33127/g.107605  ORF Transcript_33127/g.107605 Transcript_33127/m.107605 type:complete len:695 (-) Transcript_33127:500-2584(-)